MVPFTPLSAVNAREQNNIAMDKKHARKVEGEVENGHDDESAREGPEPKKKKKRTFKLYAHVLARLLFLSKNSPDLIRQI